MIDLSLPLWGNILVFLGTALAIGMAGVKMAGYADELADRTGLGEAITGMVMLGLITALPGIAASVTAAVEGHPGIAISNAMGGIAVQTVALAAADLFYRKANLEHAAASVENLLQTILLILLMSLVLMAIAGPDVTLWHVHPMTLLLFAAAGFAIRIVYQTRERPMWKPTATSETVKDVPDESSSGKSLRQLVLGLLITGAITTTSGSLAAEAAEGLLEQTDLTASVVGGLFLAIVTSLPELVTSIGSVRRGAVTLAVSGVVGGNFFDVLFVSAADLFYRPGSLFHAREIGNQEVFVTTLAIVLNGVLLSGLLYRQRRGPANIGFEGLLMILLYALGFLILWAGV